MGQLSPYFIYRMNGHPSEVETEFSPLTEEVEPWMKVREYWRIFNKRFKLILGVSAAVVTVVALHDFVAARLYTATTTLLINNKMPHLFGDAGTSAASNEDDSIGYDSADQTEYELLRSRSIAARVIQAEGLLLPTANSLGAPTLSRRILTWVRAWSPFAWASTEIVPEPRGENAVPSAAIDNYLRLVRVTPIENTHIVKVSVTSTNAELAARLANAHAEQFVRRGIELKSQASEDAGRFLAEKLTELKKQVEQSELALNNYRREKGIIPGLISVSGKEDVVLDRLNKINQDLQEAHLKNIGLETEVALVKEGRADALPEVIESPLIQKLKGELDVLEVQAAGMANQFKPTYPPMQELKARIQGTQDALAQEIRSAVSSLHEQYQASLEAEKTLGDELEKQKSFALGLNDAAVRYLILEREAETNRELYNSVLKRMKDMALLADAHASNISIVDKAEPPGFPSSPKTATDLLQAALLGLAAAFGLAFVLEHLDTTLKYPDEAQSYLRVPNLAITPEVSFVNKGLYLEKQSADDRALQSTGRRATGHSADIVTAHGAQSLIGESYRTLRTALLLSRAGARPKITLITSALPNEGKTAVTVNTAIVLAHTGAQVLIIDADLRKPRCHKVLSIKNHFGLTEILTGSANEEAISCTKVENLHLLSSGKVPPNPSELLGSTRMREVLETLSKAYDYIIIDSPPVMVVADSVILSAMADGVVLVAAGGQTPKQQVRAAIGRLQQANARIFGFVLNKVRIHKFDHPYQTYADCYQQYYSNGAERDEDAEEDSYSARGHA
jgi:succinoglycan biosynthesis transport protein ExoP